MARRIFRLCIVLSIVWCNHHADCESTSSTSTAGDDDSLLSPPRSIILGGAGRPHTAHTLPTPIASDPSISNTFNTERPPTTVWAARNAALGSALDVTCPVRVNSPEGEGGGGKRAMTVRWFRNGRAVNGTVGDQLVLRILYGGGSGGGMTSAVEGNYTCLVEFGGGGGEGGAVLSSPVEVRLASMHEFTAHPQDVAVPEGEPAIFHCAVNSNPPAVISWQRNSLPVSSTLPDDSYLILPSGALLIKRVHSNYVGTYRCQVFNTILNKPRLSKRAKLRLQQKTPITNSLLEPPEILLSPIVTNGSSLFGDDVSLYCFARGKPDPIITWYKDGNLVGVSNIFVIRNVTEGDSGKYKCEAANNASTTTQYFTVNVFRPPHFNITPQSTVFPSAKTVRLYCDAVGNPKPEVEWLKNGRKLTYDGRVKLSQGTLVLSHSFSTDAGIYQCVASNTYGRIWSVARLSITMPFGQPQPPQNVTCRAYDAGSICVQWRPPHGLNASAYSVHTIHLATTRMLTEEVTNDTSMLVRHLHTNTSYSFYVRGYVRSASDQSASVVCETVATAAEATRRRFVVQRLNDSSVLLTWHTLASDWPCAGEEGGGGMAYKLQYRHTTAASPTTTTITTTSPHHLITNLTPSTPTHPSRYRFHVEPTSTVTSTSHSSAHSHNTSSTLTNNNNHLIPLRNAFDYVVPLPGTDPSLDSHVTSQSAILHKEVVEGVVEEADEEDEEEFFPPFDLSVQLLSHDAVLLVWEDGNAQTQFYTVCYAPAVREGPVCGGGGGSAGSGQEFKTCSSKSIQVNHLHQNMRYEFRVRAHAADGITSSYSTSIEVNTMDLLSSAVQNLDYFIINASCVCVTWQKPPYLQNSTYANYTVAYGVVQKKPEEDWRYVTVSSGPGIKQHSCYRSDDSTTLLPFSNVATTAKSSGMSLLVSELKPNLNYSLYVKSPGSNPGVTITISTGSAFLVSTAKENGDNVDGDVSQIERAKHTRREQILGVIVGVCVSVPMILAVICWFKVWPWFRRRRDDRRRRRHAPHLNGGGGADAAALMSAAKGRPRNNHSTPETQQRSPNHHNHHHTDHRIHQQQRHQHCTNNNASDHSGDSSAAAANCGNGVGVRGLLLRTSSSATSCATGHTGHAASVEEADGLELQRLLTSPAAAQADDDCADVGGGGGDMRGGVVVKHGGGGGSGGGGCVRITENPQFQCSAANGFTDTTPSSVNADFPHFPLITDDSTTNVTNCRRQHQLLADSPIAAHNIQIHPRRQSPALAPNG